MAGAIDLAYLIVAVVGGIVGLVFVASVINATSSEGPRAFDWAVVTVGVVFLVVLGLQFAI